MSIRKSIMDRVLAALATITTGNGYNTTVRSVTEKLQQYDQIPNKNLPCLMPIDADEARGWEALSGHDLRGELTIIISCVVKSGTNATRTARLNLMLDIEKCLMNDATLAALIIDIEPQSIITDKGTIPNYSLWDQYYKITYFYSSADGG
jgi:hypothetical protein